MTIQIPDQVNTTTHHKTNTMQHSDHLTVSTVSESSEELLSPTRTVRRSSKSKRRGSGSRRKRNSLSRKNKAAANRDMLMGLIAQEMTSSWKDEEDVTVPTSTGLLPEDPAPTAYSAADIFYAQMNGEVLSVSGSIRGSTESLPSVESSTATYEQDGLLLDDVDEEDEQDDVPDHTSFAGLALPFQQELPARPIPDDLSVSKRSRSTKGSASSRVSDSSNHSGELSIDEIQEYVMANMPEEIKNKIPKEAWGRIFGKSSIDKTRKPKISMPVEDEEEEVEEDEGEDDSSVISDITEYTDFVKANAAAGSMRRRIAPLAPEEEKNQSEELCPTLATDPFTVSDRTYEGFSLQDTSCAAESSTHRSSKTSSGVNFGRVQVRYYERVLEVNPAVTNGAAVGIGWRYKRGGSISVDDWELNRGEVRKVNDLIMSRNVRENLLKDLGYTQKDIATATRIILKAKNNRKVTVQHLPNQHMEEAVESAARKVKGLLSFGRNKGIVASY